MMKGKAMTVDERKRGELIASNEIAQLGPAKVKELRESADALVQQLVEPPQLEQVRSTLLAMMRILRPLTGEDIGRFAESSPSSADGEDEDQ